jgi:hypothetical protein
VGLASEGSAECEEHRFTGARTKNKLAAATAALTMLRGELEKVPTPDA